MKHKLDKRMLDLFWYWVNERQCIYVKKRAGGPWPWTDDDILQTYKFTNVYRNLDAVTVSLHELVFASKKYRSQSELMFAIILFRMFNWPMTFKRLENAELDINWNEKKASEILNSAKRSGEQVFTGAYMITNCGCTGSKIDMMCSALSRLHENSDAILQDIKSGGSFEAATNILSRYRMIGRFIAYELATDFRWAGLFEPKDIMTWANPGPGAKRGVKRLLGHSVKTSGTNVPDSVCVKIMQELLSMKSRWEGDVKKRGMEMRDIEHSLCEFDKYVRVLQNEGRPRSRYTPPLTSVEG